MHKSKGKNSSAAMEEANQPAPEITKEKIQNLRFPYKLWILTNTPNRAVTWCRDGTAIQLDYIALDWYLSSSLSIFKSRTGSQFLRQLCGHGFVRLSLPEDTKESVEPILMEFQHPCFIQNRQDLVVTIRYCCTDERTKQLPKELDDRDSSCHFGQQRINDPCFVKIKSLNFVERSRLNLRILLQMQNENYTLNRKLMDCEQKSPSSSVSVIELPADAFENPFDSISRFEENPEYAGYYGNATTEQIKQFFDEYLPIYAQANGEEISEKQGMHYSQRDPTFQSKPCQSTSSTFSYIIANNEQSAEIHDDLSESNPSNFQINYSVNVDANDNKEYAMNVLEDACSRVAPTDPAIVSVEDNGIGRDEDISMDQYLKFRDSSRKSTIEGFDHVKEIKLEAPDHNVVPNSTTDGDRDATENVNGDDVVKDETNFKNFFNQYRESINLLYD